jgi:hypothetical protein
MKEAEFDKWARQRFPVAFRNDTPGNPITGYAKGAVASAREGWRAALAAVVQEPAEEPVTGITMKRETCEGRQIGHICPSAGDACRYPACAHAEPSSAATAAKGVLTEEQIEAIASSWDECHIDAPGGEIEVGPALRRQLREVNAGKTIPEGGMDEGQQEQSK